MEPPPFSLFKTPTLPHHLYLVILTLEVKSVIVVMFEVNLVFFTTLFENVKPGNLHFNHLPGASSSS